MGLNGTTFDHLPTIEASLNFTAPSAERLRTYTFPPPQGEPWTNIVPEEHVLPIHDLRPIESEITLDHNGFQLVHQATSVADFWNEEEIRKAYYLETEILLKRVTGADRVHIFDHTLRRRVPGVEDSRRSGPRQPANRLHVDQTIESGPARLRFELPDEADELLRGRVQIINVWRPIKGPLYDAPLVMGDARSVAPQDLVASDLIFPDRSGEIYLLNYNPAHRWFYVSAMKTDEALLLKCYDSATDGRARFSPHGSFLDPTAPKDAPLRESIEVRALTFHKP
jgi:hypothetical protein